jgi:Tfp pilus assembly protein PilN
VGRSVEPLPEETEQAVGTPRIVLWLVATSLLGLLLPLYLISTTIEDNNQQLQTEITQIDQEIETLSQPQPEQTTLQDTLLRLRRQQQELETLSETLITQHINWPAVITVIGNYAPSPINFTSLAQEGDQITINGEASTEVEVMAYARMLEESDLFTRVVVQSLALTMQPTPSPQPEITPLPPDQIVEFVILVELTHAEVGNE